MCRPRYYITKKADQDSSLLIDNETHRTDSIEEAILTAHKRGGNLIWDDQEMKFFEVGSARVERYVPIKMNEVNARNAKEFLATGFSGMVIIQDAPITGRMWKKGDVATVRNGKIRMGGCWFDLDDRFTVTCYTEF